MKKLLLTLALVMGILTNTFSQATSLIVDCQNPGWLSSYINPSILPTLRNLTVTGQINKTDLATIGNLVKNYNVQGRLDLSDVTIVENRLSADMFGVTGCKLELFALPKSLGLMEKCIEWVEVDTLICGCFEQPDFLIGGSYNPIVTDYCSDINNFRVKHLIIREGIESFHCNSNKENNIILESILFPNSIKHISINRLKALYDMNVPEGVETFGPRLNTNIHFTSDTLYVQPSVKTFWDTWADHDYRNADLGSNRNTNGRIKCLYLPENLETFWVVALHYGAQVDIHIKSKIPPKIENGWLISNTIVYVPLGYKEIYKSRDGWKEATIIEEVYAEKITISVPSIMYTNETYNLSANFTPSNTTFKDVLWTSSDNTILSISNNGMCSANKPGAVTITAMNADKSCSDVEMVRVYDHTTGISLSNSTLMMNIGTIQKLQALTLPLGTSDGRINWSTSNDMVASISEDGTIKAIGRGTCTITATSVDGEYSAECVIIVQQPVEAITLEKHNVSLKVGEAENLFVQVSPTTADNKTVIWSSSDIQIASIDNNGNVTAIKSGEAWIKAVSNDNAEAKDSCKVTVIQPVTGITISQESCQMSSIGESFQLEATVLPEDASNKEVRWSSSNESICMVSQGKVIATGYGTAVVIASTVDGGFLASCVVNVEDTSAIQETTVDNQNDSPIYDLMGCKVKKVIKGSLYIQNGQKFIAK